MDEMHDKRAAQLHHAGDAPGWAARLQASLTGADPRRFLNFLQQRLKVGRLHLRLPGGDEHHITGAQPGPEAGLHIHDWRFVPRVFTSGALGFAQSYIDGHWDSPDLPRLLELATLNRRHLGETVRGSGLAKWAARLMHRLRANTKRGAKRNIAFHYDLGNGFYAEWLDPSMTYSAAIFEDGDNSLEAAQLRKYRRLLDELQVKAGEHILEVGCGWGGFAETAARDYGARVTGITLSREQLKFAQNRIEKAGLRGQVDFQLTDYRDMKGHFDHIASIEMFEAVGEKYWTAYFDKIQELLKPGGRAAIQFIAIEEAVFEAYRRSTDFIQTYIFPGGMLPTTTIFKDLAERSGLMTVSEAAFGQHYAKTLGLWRERFHDAFANGRLPAGFDERFKRIWDYYLAYCEGGFRAGGIDVLQVALQKRV